MCCSPFGSSLCSLCCSCSILRRHFHITTLFQRGQLCRTIIIYMYISSENLQRECLIIWVVAIETTSCLLFMLFHHWWRSLPLCGHFHCRLDWWLLCLSLWPVCLNVVHICLRCPVWDLLHPSPPCFILKHYIHEFVLSSCWPSLTVSVEFVRFSCFSLWFCFSYGLIHIVVEAVYVFCLWCCWCIYFCL